MKRLLVCLGFCCCLATATADAEVVEPVVIVLSWDGLRHDYLEVHGARGELPALRRMAAEGVRAGRLTPVFPSSTFPGHVSMATGTYPDRHGIVDNRFYDREAGPYRDRADANWIQAEPLWIAAERQGVPAATYFWVGSETDWRGQGTRYRISPFSKGRPEAEKVDQILSWLQLPASERPRLIMSYWAGADDPGHDYGPLSRRVAQQLRDQDAQLGRLMAGLDAMSAWTYTTLMLVGDHGMTETGTYLDLSGILAEQGISARVFGSPVANVFLDDPTQRDAARSAIAALGPVRVYEGAELPDRLRLRHPTRTGDLVVITDPPYVFGPPEGLQGLLARALAALGWSFGGHGYDPGLPDMGAAFMAMGRGVPAGLEISEAHQTDLAATVAQLLDIEPPLQSEGRAISAIGGSGD